MACQLLESCQFFKNLEGFPKTAEYIKTKLCRGQYESCSRFRVYVNYGRENVPFYLDPSDREGMKNIIQCLRDR